MHPLHAIKTITFALCSSLLICSEAFAQPYPSQSIRVIVPFAAGGNLDVTARIVSAGMSKILGQSMVVENRPGAGGLIGHEFVAKTEPNGYTLLVTANGSFAYAPKMTSRKSFSSTDFAAIGMIAITPMVLEVLNKEKFGSFQDFIAQAKNNPNTISIGHAGNGTTNHIAIIQLQQSLGVNFTVVPYKGSAPAINDLLGAQIDAVVDQLPSSMANLTAGKLRALAVTSATRSKDLPETPTINELIQTDFEVVTASGLIAPAQTPVAIIEKLNQALNQTLKDPDIQQRLAALGSIPSPMTAGLFQDFLRNEDQKANLFVRKGLLKVED